MDPRWQNLPHTDTEFVPVPYPDRTGWEARRAALKKQVLFAAGLWPLPEKPPLKARIWHRLERDGYTIEKVSFQSLPGLYVGGTLFRPADPRPTGHPGVLAPHGHSALGRLDENENASYQARGLTLARIGCTAFMWDMVGYNDSARHLAGTYQDETYSAVHRSFCCHGADASMLWNLNAFGLQLWNSIRALDFVAQLPEVDPERLVCTGESGGGTQTFALYAVDERLAAAAPVCMVSAFMQGGCGCENAPLLRLDTHNVDLGAACAPKPLMLVSSAQDWTQNTPAVEYPAIRRIYDLYGAGERVEQEQVDAPHGYNKAMREIVYRWLGRVFDLPVAADYTEPPYQTEAPDDLHAFAEGLPEDALTNGQALIDQRLQAAQTALEAYTPRTREAFAENRQVLGTALALAVGYDKPDAVYQRTGPATHWDIACEDGVLTGSTRGTTVPLRTFTPDASCSTATLLVHPQGGKALYSPLISRLLEAKHTVYTIDCFATGANIGPQDPEKPRGDTRYFNTFNRSDDAERVGDIALTLRFLLDSGCQRLNAVGFGRAGAWLMLAGTFFSTDQSLRLAIDADRFSTDKEEAYLARLPIPGILAAGGLPNAAALLAPRDLLLHNTGTTFDTAWAHQAFGLYPDANLHVEEGRVANDALVSFLVQP